MVCALLLLAGLAAAAKPSCDDEAACAALVNKIQIRGTQEAYAESLLLLNDTLQIYENSSKLWGLLGKLHIFYLMQWSLAEPAVERGLTLNGSDANLHIFKAWLTSTPFRRNATVAEASMLAGIDAAPSDDFWPHFEYAAWLSHVAGSFNKSRDQYEIVMAKSADNPLLQFFYGLLLKYHLEEETKGADMIAKARAVAASLPGQAASNLAFQAQLLAAVGRLEEAAECCSLSGAILDPAVTPASLICSMVPDQSQVVLV